MAKELDFERFSKFSLTSDAVVFTIMGDVLKLLLIKRGNPPFEGMYALPGGFLRDATADYKLRDFPPFFGQLQVFRIPDQEPLASFNLDSEGDGRSEIHGSSSVELGDTMSLNTFPPIDCVLEED